MFSNHRTMKIIAAAKQITINEQEIDREKNSDHSEGINLAANCSPDAKIAESQTITSENDQTEFEPEPVEPEPVEPEPGSSSTLSGSRNLRIRNHCAKYSDSEDDDDSVEDPSYEIEVTNRQPFHVVADSENQVVSDSDDQNNGSHGNLNDYKGRPKKGRKRKFQDQNRAQKKNNKNSNKSYYNYKSVRVDPKQFIDFQCNCPKKCWESVSTERRKLEFDRYWSLQSYDSQTNFIAASVTESTKQRLYGRNPAKRTYSRKYKIDDKVVCRSTFTKTLGISTCRVDTALKKFHGRIPLTDQRGIAGGRNKLPDTTIQNVIDQINKIPQYISHYCRPKTEAKFLPSGMTIQKMYEVYCSEENNPVSIATYKRIFYTKFNLRMKPLKKDTCNTCDTLKTKVDIEENAQKKDDISKQHNEHLQLAEEAQRLRRQDFQKSKECEDIECLTFDLEKTLPLPRIPTNIVFYKRQLWVYNAGIHSGKYDRGYCYVWVEGKAGRGSQEVGSCLMKHIQNHLPPTVKHLIFWSDACGGQNRNIKLTLLLKSILHQSQNLETITMNFLISGHSFLPNDSDFSDIESALKHQQRLYTPDDYIDIMKTCRKKNPLVVTKMDSDDFFSVEKIEKNIVNRKQTEMKEKINWLHVRTIKLQKDEPFYIQLRHHNFTNEYQRIFIKKKTRGRPYPADSIFKDLVPLWPQGKPIAEPKLKNLNEMLHLIPADALSFYTNLKSDPQIIEDIDGFDTEHLDFDVDGE